MPAGMVRPRASQVPPLGAGALAEYQQAGWTLTEHGGIDAGQRIGPCSMCRTPCVLYGPFGHPLCVDCNPDRPRPPTPTPAEYARQRAGQ